MGDYLVDLRPRAERQCDRNALAWFEDTRVFEVDEESATATVFKVQRKDGVWTIPSHYDYPADAKDRMAKAAGVLIALRKGAVRSEARADHADLGVVDPREAGGDVNGLGMLVTFRSGDEEVVAELIIGKEVAGRMGQVYVRIPGQRRTYMAEMEADLSTRFADWVETDLLKLSAYDIERLMDTLFSNLGFALFLAFTLKHIEWVRKGISARRFMSSFDLFHHFFPWDTTGGDGRS